MALGRKKGVKRCTGSPTLAVLAELECSLIAKVNKYTLAYGALRYTGSHPTPQTQATRRTFWDRASRRATAATLRSTLPGATQAGSPGRGQHRLDGLPGRLWVAGDGTKNAGGTGTEKRMDSDETSAEKVVVTAESKRGCVLASRKRGCWVQGCMRGAATTFRHSVLSQGRLQKGLGTE
jgi:hypothetical protein